MRLNRTASVTLRPVPATTRMAPSTHDARNSFSPSNWNVFSPNRSRTKPSTLATVPVVLARFHSRTPGHQQDDVQDHVEDQRDLEDAPRVDPAHDAGDLADPGPAPQQWQRRANPVRRRIARLARRRRCRGRGVGVGVAVTTAGAGRGRPARSPRGRRLGRRLGTVAAVAPAADPRLRPASRSVDDAASSRYAALLGPPPGQRVGSAIVARIDVGRGRPPATAVPSSASAPSSWASRSVAGSWRRSSSVAGARLASSSGHRTPAGAVANGAERPHELVLDGGLAAGPARRMPRGARRGHEGERSGRALPRGLHHRSRWRSLERRSWRVPTRVAVPTCTRTSTVSSRSSNPTSEPAVVGGGRGRGGPPIRRRRPARRRRPRYGPGRRQRCRRRSARGDDAPPGHRRQRQRMRHDAGGTRLASAPVTLRSSRGRRRRDRAWSKLRQRSGAGHGPTAPTSRDRRTAERRVGGHAKRRASGYDAARRRWRGSAPPTRPSGPSSRFIPARRWRRGPATRCRAPTCGS